MNDDLAVLVQTGFEFHTLDQMQIDYTWPYEKILDKKFDPIVKLF